MRACSARTEPLAGNRLATQRNESRDSSRPFVTARVQEQHVFGVIGCNSIAALELSFWLVTITITITITIAIAIRYSVFRFQGHGLLTAVEPWSGHYEVSPPVYAAAHHTQFVSPDLGCKFIDRLGFRV